MADVRYKNDSVIVDPGTPTQQLAISAGGAASVNLIASSATVTVDTELAAAAALADATANPTISSLAALQLVYNGTTWDRRRSAAAALDSTGTGIANSALVGQFDDASTQTVTENQFAHVRISTRRALLVEGVASGTALTVTMTSTTITGTVTVDSELPTAAALADATANPTVPIVGAANLTYNGSTFDRQRSVVAAQDTTGTGIAAAGILGQLDDASTAAVTENQFAPVRISTRRALLVEGVASGTALAVTLTSTTITGTVTVDSELATAAALADATANPTITTIASYLMGYNGTTWDRVRTANTGRLQVDVVTGGSSDTPTTPIVRTVSIAALAAGSSSTTELRTVELGGSTKKLTQIQVWSSVAFKADLQTVANGAGTSVVVGGGQAFMPYNHIPPGDRTGRNYYSVAHPANAGFDGWQIIVTNLDASEAADIYATFYYED